MDGDKVYNWLRIMQRLAYPYRCVLCGAAAKELEICPGCAAELARIAHPCRLCGLPLKGHDGGICGECLKKKPPLDGSRIPFRYAAPLDRLLLDLKFNARLARAPLLAALWLDSFDGDLPELIIPVPLHPSRLRERGYNQSHELARHIGAELGIAANEELCHRLRATEAQSRLDAKERRKNLRGAFELLGDVKGRHIAILDDVVTTGTTAFELARVLRRGGARSVVLWALARALPPG